MMSISKSPAKLDVLREQIKAIEWKEKKSHDVFPFGIPMIDEALGQGGLATACVHEWLGAQRSAVIGVCAGILAHIAKRSGPILWCSSQIDLCPDGLKLFGLSHQDLIFVQSLKKKEILWALEESLNSPQLGAVVAELSPLSLAESRRIHLGAQKSGVPVFLLLGSHAEMSSGSVATTRWHISPLSSSEAPGLWRNNGIGETRFCVELQRCRGGKAPQKWSLEWNASTLSFNLLSESFKHKQITRVA